MRPVRTALLAGAAVVLLAPVFHDKIARKTPDLEVYWKAAVRARAAEPLYRIEDQHYQFKYLPAFAVLAIPLGFVSLGTAKMLWFCVSIGLIAALVALSLRLLPAPRKPPPLLVGIVVLAMGKFYGHELVLGQVNALLGVIVVLAVLAIRRGREPLAGGLIALAIVVKPYAVIFLPWIVARLRWGSIAAATLGVAALLTLPALTYGWHGNIELHRAWWQTVAGSTAPNLTNADNVSIAGMYAKWLGTGAMVSIVTGATVVVLLAAAAVVFWRRRRVDFPEGLEGSLLLTLIPLCSPQGWDYVFLLSTPLILFIVNYEDRLPGWLRALAILAIAAIGLSIYDVMGRAAYSAFMAWSMVTVCYLVVVGTAFGLRARAAA